jgi:predicted nucleic acid-binding protein
MAKSKNKKWALDTNVVLDLARGVDAALSLQEISQEQGYTLHITRTALEELFHLATTSDDVTRTHASKALRNLSKNNILPIALDSSAKTIASEFSNFLRLNGAIPESEVNDGRILAEASLGEAALLVSSDSHLISIDPDDLRMYFIARDLAPVPVTTPVKVLRFFEKLSRITGRY